MDEALRTERLVLKNYLCLLSNSLVAITNNKNYNKVNDGYFRSIKETFLNTNTRISLAMVDAVPAEYMLKNILKYRHME